MLAHTEPMKEKEVMEELVKIEEVLEAHMITAQHDVLAVLHVKRQFLESEYQTIFYHAISKIEGVKHVMDTNTIIGMASQTKLQECVQRHPFLDQGFSPAHARRQLPRGKPRVP